MRQELIFAPMGALALWTSVVLILVPIVRVFAGRRGAVADSDFKLGESARVPGWVSVPNRNYMNLLEFPLLFYVVCILYYVSHSVDRAALELAWLYAGLRVLHSLMHLTFNIVPARALIFAASSIAATAMWLLFLVKIFPGGIASAFAF